MHFGILSGGTGWHVQDLLRAARDLGHSAEAIDFRTISSRIPQATPLPFETLLVRTMPAGSLEQIVFRMDWLHAMDAAGMQIVNPPKALEACVDKFLTTAKLARAGLTVPRTFTAQTSDEALMMFEELGSDVVVKPLFGSEGRGLVRVTDREIAWRTFRAIEHVGGVLYLQEFVRHPGWDLRVFVLKGRVLGCMKRTARNDWRTNVAQGGTAENYQASFEIQDLALRAATATGAIVAGVDLIMNDHREWLVLEVNAVPGWKALAQACGIDVAKEILRGILE